MVIFVKEKHIDGPAAAAAAAAAVFAPSDALAVSRVTAKCVETEKIITRAQLGSLELSFAIRFHFTLLFLRALDFFPIHLMMNAKMDAHIDAAIDDGGRKLNLYWEHHAAN